ncbi:hypothetical protein C8Q74DRAFT_1297304 [Fomes fomentarius]|nr:hypothetical protein C8Q74DRAFT_1297304 [Fomes fomentarius]
MLQIPKCASLLVRNHTSTLSYLFSYGVLIVTTSIPLYLHQLLSMSSDESDDLAQEILEYYGRLAVENYCIIGSSMLLWADSIFTFTEEIQRIWGRNPLVQHLFSC